MQGRLIYVYEWVPPRGEIMLNREVTKEIVTVKDLTNTCTVINQPFTGWLSVVTFRASGSVGAGASRLARLIGGAGAAV
jgi:hypothetical protein